MPVLDPSMQSTRFSATMSLIVRTPLPASPTIQASAPRSSSSHEAFETLPILRYRRCMWSAFFDLSGRQRGIRKQLKPRSVWANVRKASHIGAETKNL